MIEHAYTRFSVSLDDFLWSLKLGGKLPPASLESDKTCNVSVGFIQVCRSSLGSCSDSWEALADQGFLKYVYESGTAVFVCPGCPVIDLVMPLRIETSAESEFIPMLVSIKCHTSFGIESAADACAKMTERATTDNLTKAFCLLVVFGWKSRPQSKTEKARRILTTFSISLVFPMGLEVAL